jgi:hypothetical protein
MHSLRTTLSSLPSTLDETYTLILDKIDAADRSQVYHILQCVCFSERPLRVEDLAATPKAHAVRGLKGPIAPVG